MAGAGGGTRLVATADRDQPAEPADVHRLAATVAEAINHHVQEDAADGFVLVPHLTPSGLDDFVDRVVPLLRERGVFRDEYAGTTLRSNLGLQV